ncbi:MAG: hypothetical protein QOF84_4357 [Streptomyces sp.]|jgi:acyl transferase domain-containing protein|nr:hypothetical protein [Streptomyces sp.]MDX6349567.1 hypothetical protein [Streptomyces sp.]
MTAQQHGQQEPHDPREEAYAEWLEERLDRYLGRTVPRDQPLADFGLDSVAALSLYGDIEEEYGPLIEPSDIWEYPSVRELARYLAMRDPRPDGANPVRVALVFTGQGSQHPGMTSGLYLHSGGYRAFLDEAAEALRPYTDRSVVDLILSCDPRVDQTAFTHPALFAVEYALARTLEQAGVQPAAVLGHGIGEFAAAVIGGALSLADAAKLVAVRGAFLQYLPDGGGMMATCASAEEAEELAAAEPEVAVAAVNAEKAVVLSGALDGLDRIRRRLDKRGIAAVPLNVSHAFHSPLMKPVCAKFETVARRLPGAPSRLPYYSTVRGRMTGEPLYAPYWTEHITAPVRFADAARLMIAQQDLTHIVEIGPKLVLTPFLRRMGGTHGPVCVAVCRNPQTNAVDLAGVLSSLDAWPLSEALSRTCR